MTSSGIPAEKDWQSARGAAILAVRGGCRPRSATGPDRRDKGTEPMTHTVCAPYTDCCVVCPVECFYMDDMMLYIDPVDCIDCEACVPECPVEAIFAEANVPAQWAAWTPLNAEKAAEIKAAGTGHITEKMDAKEG